MGFKDDSCSAGQGNLEMVKYCVANDCPIDGRACASAAENGDLSASNTYTKKRKRLRIGELLWRQLKMVTFIYSNILSSVSMINMTK